ncbi:MAG: NAD(P)H-quinone oxidoreductase [Sandaracinus sp.]|nr:NAD(P)H-quinone oxidoreductase [Myxococcales bacterium]MCB9617155.1 NAD(P)H-quinone oxidoreductase [Sandaracinus sp.]MCB9633084.1 NAD(P)H-quinone oxidoreductase [Sandaracinus sp.]
MSDVKGRAVRIRGAGGPEVLELDDDYRTRAPGPGEVRVEVVAAGLNRADCLQRRGFYPAPPGAPKDIPGLELAGRVESVGEGVTAWKVGDGVMAITGGGAMATHVILHERELVAVPEGLGFEEAAAIPEVFFTAYDALEQASLRSGEVLLVHAIASGVGTAALQLAKAAGAHVVGTSRSASKLEGCRDLGLDDGLLVDGSVSFANAVKAVAPRGADVILDTIGAKYVAENLRALAPRGRVVTIGLLGGVKAELDLGLLLAKRATWSGSVLRARPLEEKATLAQAVTREMLPLFRRQKLRPIVDAVLPMEEIRAAHERMESNETFGKLVLRW